MKRVDVPLVTTADLVRDLQAVGVSRGQTLMVHSSMRSLGYVLGGAPAVVRALLAALGPSGTLVMPGFSPEVSDPARWHDRPFPDDRIEQARAHVPAFDPDTTPTSMGVIPETFRRWPGTLRGPHPQVSVCALGPWAEEVVVPHPLAWGQGAGSPFERLTRMAAGPSAAVASARAMKGSRRPGAPAGSPGRRRRSGRAAPGAARSLVRARAPARPAGGVIPAS